MIPSLLRYMVIVSFGYGGEIEPVIVRVRSLGVLFKKFEDRFIDIEDEFRDLPIFDDTWAGEVGSLFSREMMMGVWSVRRGGTSPTFQSIADVHSAIQYFFPLSS